MRARPATSTDPRRRGSRLRSTGALFILGAMVTFAGVATASSAMALSVAPSDIDLTITVAPTPPPVPGTSETPVDPDPSPDPSSSTGPLVPVRGTLVAMSGLRTQYHWSPNPAQGSVAVSYTVRNLSHSTIGATSRFWLTNAVGATVSQREGISLSGLKPGKTRVISATLDGVGQWTVLRAHATLTPPSTVDGRPVKPITRDSFVFVPPWLTGSVSVLACGGFFAFHLIRLGRLAALAAAAA